MNDNIKVGLIGSNDQVEMLVCQLNDIGLQAINLNGRNTISNLKEIDILHGIYAFNCIKTFLLAKVLRKKTINHWIGTDVYEVQHDFKSRFMSKLSDIFIDKQIVVSNNLKKELSALGFDPEVVPIVSEKVEADIMPVPEKFSVLTYMIDGKAGFYGMEWIFRLAKNFSDIEFSVAYGTGKGEVGVPENVRYLGNIDNMDQAYQNASVILRLTKHDGLSCFVLESLARGKQVIWTVPFPHCIYVQSYEEVEKKMRELLKGVPINYDGAKYVKENFNLDKVMSQLKELYLNLYNA